MMMDAQAARNIRIRSQRQIGWIQIQDGYGSAVARIVKKGFDDLSERMNRRGVLWDEDLLDLIQDLERQLIELIVEAVAIWGNAELKSRRDNTVPVITVEDAVAEVEGLITSLTDRFWRHVNTYKLIDMDNPEHGRAVLYLSLMEEHVRLYLPKQIKAWK
jgi:hypothetical protein